MGLTSHHQGPCCRVWLMPRGVLSGGVGAGGLAQGATASLLAADARAGLSEDTTHRQQHSDSLWVLATNNKPPNSDQGERRISCLFSSFFFFIFPLSTQILQIQTLSLLPAPHPPGWHQRFASRAEPDPRVLLHLLFELPGGAKGGWLEALTCAEPQRLAGGLGSGVAAGAPRWLRLGGKLCGGRSRADLEEVCGQRSESYRRTGEAKRRQRAKVEGAAGGQGRCSRPASPGGISTAQPRC